MQTFANKPFRAEPLQTSRNTEDETTQQRWRNDPPAKEFVNGRVVTRVWANPNHWGEITWRVDQLRIRYGAVTNSAVARSFHLGDLDDAIRGLYWARQWVKKAERRSRWRFLSWKCW